MKAAISTTRKSPGRTEYDPITLERGVTHDSNTRKGTASKLVLTYNWSVWDALTLRPSVSRRGRREQLRKPVVYCDIQIANDRRRCGQCGDMLPLAELETLHYRPHQTRHPGQGLSSQ